MKKYYLSFLFVAFIFSSESKAQELDESQIKSLVKGFKTDVRGPYKDIRWFCTDGSLRQPKDPCPENIGPGVQHARYKDAVVQLGKTNHLYFGQILTATDYSEFWDADQNHSRLKQYQIDKYLRTVDNGWINQKGQFYRGAIQAEDEEAWGIEFYKWLLDKDANVTQNFFLIRQSLKDIPHSGDDNVAQLMRSQSKVISDEFTEFMDLRVKIHSLPEANDIEKVNAFKQKYAARLSQSQNKKLDELVVTMRRFFMPVDISALKKYNTLTKDSQIGTSISAYITSNSETPNPNQLITETAQLLLDLRTAILEEKNPKARLQLLDLSLKLEDIIYKNAQKWESKTVEELLNKICYLGMAATGAGYVELAEWEQLDLSLKPTEANSMTLGELTAVLESARRQVEWSSSMVKANYQHIVDEYATFEPLAYGFIDDKIRGSIALHLGKSVSDLGDFIAEASSLTNKVLDIPNQSGFRGSESWLCFWRIGRGFRKSRCD